MTDTPKTVFVTDRALELGIREFKAEVSDGPRIVVEIPTTLNGEPAYRLECIDKPDWHLTREAAVSRANAMRDAKLQALQQQAERVKGLRFE